MRHAFKGTRLTRFEQALRSAGIRHRLIKPRHPTVLSTGLRNHATQA